MKTIYDLAIEAVNTFEGKKVTLFESGTSKVWMEVNNGYVFVFAIRKGINIKGSWKIAHLTINKEGKLYYRLEDDYTLKTTYQKWAGLV